MGKSYSFQANFKSASLLLTNPTDLLSPHPWHFLCPLFPAACSCPTDLLELQHTPASGPSQLIPSPQPSEWGHRCFGPASWIVPNQHGLDHGRSWRGRSLLPLLPFALSQDKRRYHEKWPHWESYMWAVWHPESRQTTFLGTELPHHRSAAAPKWVPLHGGEEGASTGGAPGAHTSLPCWNASPSSPPRRLPWLVSQGYFNYFHDRISQHLQNNAINQTNRITPSSSESLAQWNKSPCISKRNHNFHFLHQTFFFNFVARTAHPPSMTCSDCSSDEEGLSPSSGQVPPPQGPRPSGGVLRTRQWSLPHLRDKILLLQKKCFIHKEKRKGCY